jgi:hypothetical protein
VGEGHANRAKYGLKHEITIPSHNLKLLMR